MKPLLGFALAGGLTLLALGGCSTLSTPPLRTVAHVDLDRYLGRWYVFAKIAPVPQPAS